MNKVSVIVPVYNGQQYINNCMNYLINQTLGDIEIIAVDDQSTDMSLAMLNVWRDQYPDKIKVICVEQKMGPGGARNCGVLAATGEYIGFMDCDDQIDITMYEKLYNVAKKEQCDIVDCGYYEEKIEQSILSYTDDVVGELDAEKKSKIIAGVGYAVTKIFKAEILKREDMRIRDNAIYEDLDFLIHAVLLAKRVGNVKEVLYIYKNNPQSVSKKNNEQKKFDDMIKAYDAIKILKENQLDCGEEVEEALTFAMISCVACAVGICLLNQDNKEFDLVNNLKLTKKLFNNYKGWADNTFVNANMPQDNKDILKWFEGLKL